ncbi:MAG: ABC transporter ATP-binding protein, partial [Bacteroidota bacterium]
EAFNSIKDTKLFGIEGVFVDKFIQNATVFAKANARIRVQVKLPGLALDLIIFGGIMMIVLYVLATKNNLNASLPIITLYGFTAYRLKPQIQTIFNSVSNINFSRASLGVVLSDVKKLSATVEEKQTGVVDKIQFQHLSLEDIVFRYPQAEDFALRGISFEVLSRQSVALVGPSGSGKTTLVDIILGLLEQQQGKVKVNGQEVTVSNKHVWQSRLGYVPQHIYLLDDTILNNIAFGVPANKIDMQKITKALELADLAGFIGTLPAGLNTEIGERGVRLSGGQRQRIGIARALYRDPEVLVLDEATSALDGITEDNIIGSLNKLHGNITLIMIAHRLTTVQHCDCIFMMEGGKLVQEGTYQELLETNLTFKRMAKATSF